MKSPDQWYRYAGLLVLAKDGLVEGIMVTTPDATTRDGLAMGDDLQSAKARYPGLRCGSVTRESGRQYPACAGQVSSGVWVWFGGDPIANITVSHSMPEGV